MATTAKHNPHLSPIKQWNKDQQQLTQINNQLTNFLRSFNQDRSLFSQLAQWWAQQTMLQKASIMLLIVGPFLFLGVVAQTSVLITLGCALGSFFGLSWVFLENHQAADKANQDRLAATLSSLTSLLSTVIDSLSQSGQRLAAELDKLTKANLDLAQKCRLFDAEIQQLSEANKALGQNQKELVQVQEHLQVTLASADNTVEEQRTFLKQCRRVLEETTTKYQEDFLLLSTTIAELTATKNALVLDLEQSKQVTANLKKSVASLAQVIAEDTKKRHHWLISMDDYVGKQTEQLQQLTNTLNTTEQNIKLAAVEFMANVKRQKELHLQQELILSRFIGGNDSQKMGVVKAPRKGLFGPYSQQQHVTVPEAEVVNTV